MLYIVHPLDILNLCMGNDISFTGFPYDTIFTYRRLQCSAPNHPVLAVESPNSQHQVTQFSRPLQTQWHQILLPTNSIPTLQGALAYTSSHARGNQFGLTTQRSDEAPLCAKQLVERYRLWIAELLNLCSSVVFRYLQGQRR